MMIADHFISCDWGTSNFRLRVVERNHLSVLVERSTDQGVKLLYERFLQQQLDQETFFSDYLQQQVRQLPAAFRQMPLLISGMASSNLGLQELEYASFPFNGSGQDLHWKEICLPGNFPVLLISGVKDDTGMMRGEETQAIGLAGQLDGLPEGILVLPGTHSKHLWWQQGRFSKSDNFMTGELFDLLSRQSLLSTSVQATAWDEDRKAAFTSGVFQGMSGKLSATLFAIRTRQMLQQLDPADNYYFLSGLLIGDELAYLQQRRETIVLAAPPALLQLYRIALEFMLPPRRLVILEKDTLEKALLAGQHKILQLYEKSKQLSLETF